MNRNSVAATLNAQCSKKFLSAVRSDDTAGDYVCIFEQPYDSDCIGIDVHGYWCIVSDGRICSPKEQGQFCFFYRLLYSDLEHVTSLIKKGLKQNSLPYQIAYTFPFDDLIYSAIRSSSHWRDLSLKWIDQGFPLNDEMRFFLCGEDQQSKAWLKWQTQRLNSILKI